MRGTRTALDGGECSRARGTPKLDAEARHPGRQRASSHDEVLRLLTTASKERRTNLENLAEP